MKIVKNEKIVYLKTEKETIKRIILSSAKKIRDRKKLFLEAFAEESKLFQNVYYINRYSELQVYNNPFHSLPKRNLFSPLRLLLASEDITTIYIEGNNVMQHAIKNNNLEAFAAFFKSPQIDTLVNGYNQAKTVNTLGTCLSLYLKDVWESKSASLSFTFFNAVAKHPSCKFDTMTQLEKWSDKILIAEVNLVLQFQTIAWTCLMERNGNKSIQSLELLSESSEPGSIFFIQTILDRFVQNEKEKDSIDIKNLVVDTLGFGVNNGLPRSTSTLLDFPNLGDLHGYYNTNDSLLHIALWTHGSPSDKIGTVFDSYGTFEKLCYRAHPYQNKFGLTALMLCAMRGWKTFALLLDRILLSPIIFTESVRLVYFNLKDNLGRTALDYAVLYPEMQEYLKSIGCVSGTHITVSAFNSNLLGGIEKYKTHPDYNKYPTLWLETFYGDTKTVESTSLQGKEYTFLSIDINNALIDNYDIVGYFGLPLVYEFGNLGLNSYPQDLAIILGNTEMYSIWNKKLYTETGLVKPEITIGNNFDIDLLFNYYENITKSEATLRYLNTRERNLVTVFANDQILNKYLYFLYVQVNRNRYINFLIMKEYVLNDKKKEGLSSFCSLYNITSNSDDQQYVENWGFNICSPRFPEFTMDKVIRFPSVDQTRYCGCCYSVATMTMIDLNLSNQLLNNSLTIYKPGDRQGAQSYQMPLSCMSTGSCEKGGDVKKVLQWHQENYSIPLECIPYVSWKYVKDQQEAKQPIENGGKLVQLCPSTNSTDCSKKAIKITSDPKNTFRVTDMSAMIYALNQGFALVTIMRLPTDFLDFKGENKIYNRGTGGWLADSDVYSSVTNPYVAKSSFHVVVIIGYGEVNGLKYWIILNSWGDVYQSPFGEKDENGNPKMVPYCRILRGTDDVWIESSGAYYTYPLLRNEDGTTSEITPETWPLKSTNPK